MRLWHYKLLGSIDDKRLVRQHCECCALRGKGWGRKHATVDYVFKHKPAQLVLYHINVMYEMMRRGFHVDNVWFDNFYRGKELEPWTEEERGVIEFMQYPEHDEAYLQECLNRLKQKGVDIAPILKDLEDYDKHPVNRQCPHCGKWNTIMLTEDQHLRYRRWGQGEGLIQNLLPDLSIDEREMIKTGIYPDCWKEIFGDDEE